MEYEDRVFMSRLAAVHLYEMCFGKFGHFKDSSQSDLAPSNPQKSLNFQSIKNGINSMIFSHYVQDSRNVTSWRQGGINFQVFPKLCLLKLIGRLIAPSQISSCKLTHFVSVLEKCVTSRSNFWEFV